MGSMPDRYRTASGWSVEVVERSGTPDNSDGQRLRVRYCGFHVADVRTVAELEQWFPLSELEPDRLIPQSGFAGACWLIAGRRDRPAGLYQLSPPTSGRHWQQSGVDRRLYLDR